jgi:hypothetical protein
MSMVRGGNDALLVAEKLGIISNSRFKWAIRKIVDYMFSEYEKEELQTLMFLQPWN